MSKRDNCLQWLVLSRGAQFKDIARRNLEPEKWHTSPSRSLIRPKPVASLTGLAEVKIVTPKHNNDCLQLRHQSALSVSLWPSMKTPSQMQNIFPGLRAWLSRQMIYSNSNSKKLVVVWTRDLLFLTLSQLSFCLISFRTFQLLFFNQALRRGAFRYFTHHGELFILQCVQQS